MGSDGPGEADRSVRLPNVLRWLERLTARAEGPLGRVVRSARLNPLPHAGTISVFLLVVVTLTGIYLTLFFEFGYEASYRAVSKLEAHPIQRAVRGVHRYASAALVVTTVVHAWRSFVMQRFTGPRRWRWLTGWLALVVVWLAGVTGYWLIWDTRAQALNEATASLVGPLSAGAEIWLAIPQGTGWPWLLAIWAVHLLLTVLIGWLIWRHLRRTRHSWLPPRIWMWAMFGALTVASIVLPAGMLPPADFAVAPGALPLDPFMMFLLPPLLSPWRWAAILGGAVLGALAAALPWFLRRHDPPVAEVVEAACTGCELCVIDCPYLALSMSGEGEGAIAVVDEERCVGCGICLGSCAFDAITGFGLDPLAGFRVEGSVVLLCERQVRVGEAPFGAIEVRCTGALAPRALGALVERGAADVQVIGCAPGDCVYALGNVITSERLSGVRRPHVARRWAGTIRQDWVRPGAIGGALESPGGHSEADVRRVPAGWRIALPAMLVVLASVFAVRFATDAPFSSLQDTATVRLVVDHVAGSVLEQGAPPIGVISAIEVTRDGATAGRISLDPSDPVKALLDLEIPAGRGQISVEVFDGLQWVGVFADRVDLASGDRLIVRVEDAPPPPGVELGQRLFEGAGLGANLGCDVCHSLRAGERGVGPSLAGIGVAAAGRVPGLSAEEYLRQSILEPDAFVVEGYRPGQMLGVYADRLSTDEVDALVAYLLSLRG